MSKLSPNHNERTNDFEMLKLFFAFDKTIGFDKIVEREKVLALYRLLKYKKMVTV